MFRFIVVTTIWLGSAIAVSAQSWVQIEARPTEASALERAADYASRLPDVQAYRLSSGWFAIALGPYDDATAQASLLNLRAVRAIPSDSFIADGGNFRGQIFGSDDVSVAAQPQIELRPADETLAQSRAAEAGLDRAERELVQIALRFEGTYTAAIDGAFGPGTRAAMSAWQSANGFEPTGVLSSAQRGQLLDAYRTTAAELGIERLRDETAGVEIALPLGIMGFDRYDAPFAIYGREPGPRVVLISQIGDDTTFRALYDVLQSLEIMPLDGPRSINRRSFTISGQNERMTSVIEAVRSGDAVKGFGLIWPVGDEKRRRLVLEEMRATFTPLPGMVMPDAVSTEQSIDLLAGLAIRRPDLVRSGFYVSRDGEVVTSRDVTETCARITYDEDVAASVVASDAETGLALLRPETRLAPLSLARLSATEPRISSDIAVSGFSFGGILGAPSLTYGTLDDNRGLDGDRRLARLSLPGTETDAGGPVLDEKGGVAGMLLPPSGGPRRLPDGVALAVGASTIAGFLAANGVAAALNTEGEPLDPLELQDQATGITVLVSCWN